MKYSILFLFILISLVFVPLAFADAGHGTYTGCTHTISCNNIMDGRTCQDEYCSNTYGTGYVCLVQDGWCQCTSSVCSDAPSCNDECDNNSFQCSGSTVQECYDSGSGCLEWHDYEYCANGCSESYCINGPCTDNDADGYGVGSDRSGCDYAEIDCNDSNSSINPSATEILYNGIDDDCDPSTSDVIFNCYFDSDKDGYGDENSEQDYPCDVNKSSSHWGVSNNTDCNDGDAAIHPGAAEICDGLDDDCDGTIDEGKYVKNIAPASEWDTITLSGSKSGTIRAYHNNAPDKYGVVKKTNSLNDCDTYSTVYTRYESGAILK